MIWIDSGLVYMLSNLHHFGLVYIGVAIRISLLLEFYNFHQTSVAELLCLFFLDENNTEHILSTHFLKILLYYQLSTVFALLSIITVNECIKLFVNKDAMFSLYCHVLFSLKQTFLSVTWPTGVQLLVFFCSSVPVVLFGTPGISGCRSQHVPVESSSLLHHSFCLWFICFPWWSIDEFENLHADRTSVCFEPWWKLRARLGSRVKPV